MRHRIGNIIAGEAVQKESFIEIIQALHLKSPVIIKPNWGFAVCFTEAAILDWVLTALDGDGGSSAVRFARHHKWVAQVHLGHLVFLHEKGLSLAAVHPDRVRLPPLPL